MIFKEVIGTLYEVFTELGLNIRKRLYIGQKFKIDKDVYRVESFDKTENGLITVRLGQYLK